jgi:DNA-binding PadR family transcriptional regulator
MSSPAETPSPRLTTPDLVLLSLFLERDWHGYELNAELERREVADWAGVSRPQVYYSLHKLAREGMIRPAASDAPGPGPERQVYRVTEQGADALRAALSRDDWATQRPVPPFLTWLALSPHAPRETVARLLDRRADFLAHEAAREREHLEMVRNEPLPAARVAELMISYKITSIEGEQRWLEGVRQTLLGR